MAELIPIQAPEHIFDTKNAVIYRVRRVPAYRVDEMRTSKNSDDVYRHLANFFPEWDGVIDPETGDALPNPKDDYTVFSRLDVTEQLPWINSQLAPNRVSR